MITKLSHATIYVLNQDSAYDFYVNKLGFEVRTDARLGDSFRWLTVGPKDQPDVELILAAVEPGMMFDADTAAKLRMLIADGKLGFGVFNTHDCHATYEELKAKGVKFLQAPKEQPYALEAVFCDDSGNWFSLSQKYSDK
ncbi:MAG: VOC family protein [Bacteroidetes bacterium]|nr:MAG: VOC family protein [Bacteroidota bacterium]